MQGPIIPWRPGRQDRDASYCPPTGRLPDATQGSNHLRDIFYRMGFNDQEIVALCGAHSLGRCHADRLGFEGAWTYSPTVFTNHYYDMLLGEKWVVHKWDGPRQFQGSASQLLMMLPTDLSLIEDDAMRAWVEKYAADQDLFFDDFRDGVTKLFEFGVRFAKGAERWSFKPTPTAK
jgi:cytochrome c peroxidase